MPLGALDPLQTPHAAYRALTDTDDDRRSRYRALVAEVLDKAEVDRIRAYLQQQGALGPAGSSVPSKRSWDGA